jgi:hypothetical protein
MSGPWDLVVALAPVVYRGYVERIVVSTTPRTPVRAIVAFPGQRPLTLFGGTDGTGLLVLNVTVPPKLNRTSAVAHVAVWRLRVRRSATATAVLHVSDMLLSVRAGPVVGCTQTSVIDVRYHPRAPLRILVWPASGRRLGFTIRADSRGHAAVRVRLSYARSHSPARITVQAGDATPGAHRTERITFRVSVPKRC